MSYTAKKAFISRGIIAEQGQMVTGISKDQANFLIGIGFIEDSVDLKAKAKADADAEKAKEDAEKAKAKADADKAEKEAKNGKSTK